MTLPPLIQFQHAFGKLSVPTDGTPSGAEPFPYERQSGGMDALPVFHTTCCPTARQSGSVSKAEMGP